MDTTELLQEKRRIEDELARRDELRLALLGRYYRYETFFGAVEWYCITGLHDAILLKAVRLTESSLDYEALVADTRIGHAAQIEAADFEAAKAAWLESHLNDTVEASAWEEIHGLVNH